MEEDNNNDSFIKQQTNVAKDKVKEEMKNKKNKKILKFLAAHLTLVLPVVMVLAGISIIITIILFAGFISILDQEKSSSASEAKSEAISLKLEGVGAGTSSSTKGITISYNNGLYTIESDYTDEEIENVRNAMSKIDMNSSNFSNFEIAVIGALMNSGLDINNYTVDQLKCIPLFIKTEACTSYLDLRSNSEKFDSSGNYQPKKFTDLAENEVAGIILVQRTNTQEETPTTLEYINLDTFNDMISNSNMDVINYFTINEKNNLVVAKWSYTKVEVDGEYPEGVSPTEGSERYIITTEEIAYSEYVKKYTMPFDFLMQLLIYTDEADFCIDLTDIVADSKIVINIQEEETTTKTEDKQEYTTYNKLEKIISYKMILSVKGQNATFTQTGAPVTTSNETEDTKTVTVTTTNISHTYSFEIIEADTWLSHYKKTYEPQSKEESSTEPQISEILGEYGEPISINSITDENTISNDSDANTLKEAKEDQYSDDEEYESVECDITGITTNSYSKMNINHTITVTKEKYPFDPDPTTNTHIYAVDDDGNYEKFLLIYDKYPYTRAMMDSISSWLFDQMEKTQTTVDLVDMVKYLLYMYDGIDYGVTELGDLSIFEPNKFISTTNSKGIIVKTDEMLAIQTLTREQIEEIIEKNSTGQAQENLLDALDAFMYIQDTYNVNAVFAIAVTKAESSYGTSWAAIDRETYNWCSVQGSYQGNYYTDGSGKNWRKYTSFSEAIRDFGDLIANSVYYFQAGKYNIADIGLAYCNEKWGQDVSEYIIDMYESIGITVYSGGNNVQAKVIEVATNSASYGISAEKGLCQAWVADVYNKSGANSTRASACCAVHAGAEWGVSTDFSKIQLGATVYGYAYKYSSATAIYGHVGIYIGDGQVAHNVGGVVIDDLDDWIEKYDGVCWGWNGGTDLTGGSYPSVAGLMTPNH